jgi:hypothetical protein
MSPTVSLEIRVTPPATLEVPQTSICRPTFEILLGSQYRSGTNSGKSRPRLWSGEMSSRPLLVFRCGGITCWIVILLFVIGACTRIPLEITVMPSILPTPIPDEDISFASLPLPVQRFHRHLDFVEAEYVFVATWYPKPYPGISTFSISTQRETLGDTPRFQIGPYTGAQRLHSLQMNPRPWMSLSVLWQRRMRRQLRKANLLSC